jgi:two-component system, OmpR family, phosphate regulon sensor histidine kinase PhoR
MAPRPPLLLRSLAFAAALAAPAAALLILFALSGALDPSLALIGAIAVFLGLLAPAFAHVRGLSGLAERLRGGQGPIAGMTVLPELDRAAREAVDRAQGRIEALEASLAGAESVFASLPDPLIMLNSEQRVIRANRAAETLLQEPLAGRALPGLLRHPALMAAVESALAEGVGHKVEIALSVPVERELIAHVEPLARPLPEGAAAILVLHDVTAMMRSDRMRADFIANASHELRTPLASLRGFIETLQGTAKDDPKARDRFLAIMGEQASRMTRLIDALLSLSRVEMNAHVPPSGLIDLNEVLEHARDTLEPLAKSNELRIEVEGFGRPAIVRGDRDELVQVLQNLVHNALKYGANGSKVRLEAKRLPPHGRQGTRYAIAVIDQGPGIAPEHLPRLTERFYRIEAESKDKVGTGLGLAIVKHILNRHRGELLIASKPGKGSTFTIVLNAAGEGRSERPAAAE